MQLDILRRIQRHASYSLPLVLLAIGLCWVWIEDFRFNTIGAYAILLFFGTTLGICLHKRSQGKETAWFTARAEADPTESPDDDVNPMSLDFLFVVAALIFVVSGVVLPWLAPMLRR